MNFRLSGEVQVSLSSAEPEQGEAALVLRVDPPAQLQGVLAEGGSSSRTASNSSSHSRLITKAC